MRQSLAALCLALAAPPAGAQSISVADGPEIAAILIAEGYKARLETDNAGDPMIVSGAGGAQFEVFFYDCVAGARCGSLQFSAGFDMNEPVSLDAVNIWNDRKRYAKMSVDEEGDPFLRYDINLEGGVARESLISSLGVWDSLLGEFVGFIGFR